MWFVGKCYEKKKNVFAQKLEKEAGDNQPEIEKKLTICQYIKLCHYYEETKLKR